MFVKYSYIDDLWCRWNGSSCLLSAVTLMTIGVDEMRIHVCHVQLHW